MTGSVQETKSTCLYCGVGCGVIIESQANQITGVRGDPDHPANRGRLCTKGSTLHLTASAAVINTTRLLRPQLRRTRQEALQAASWADTIDHIAARIASTVREHGPDAVGLYISGQLLTEDYYVFNKFAKGLLGTNNIDTNSRLCMSSAVAGYKQSLGADAPPNCYDDLNHAQCVFIAGSNTAWAHPVLYRRLEDARAANPAMRVIVVDPRRTETADDADLHLQIQPGTDVALFHGMLHALIWDDLVDRAFIEAHTEGFEALKALVRDTPPQLAARRCGIPLASLLQVARWFAQSGATLSLYCQGLNQSSSGTAKNTALINLHLATGQVGRPGAGPFSLTGQPNAMGGREVGGMANLLSAHRDLDNADHRAEVAKLWGVDSVPSKPGKTAVEMFEAAARGEIKVLWIACTNPAQSMPDQAMVHRALARCELVIVQDAFANTATTACADVLLPASTWGEKDGTVTNSERCISRVRRAVAPPGQARDDWRIVVDVAQAVQALLQPEQTPLLAYETAQEVWQEHRETTRGRDLDITGLSYAHLEQAGPQQWPFPESAVQGQARLYQDKRFAHANGRARFIAKPYKAVADARDATYPFSLTTSRLRDQWHGMSRSGTVASLFAHEEGPVLRLHPHDLPRRGLAPGDLVSVRSRRGEVVLPVKADDRVAGGQADMAMHWGAEFLSGNHSTGMLWGVNHLTTSAMCPDSKQPELKHAAVAVSKVNLPWRVCACLWFDTEAQRLEAQALWRQRMSGFEFASCVPVAGKQGRSGLRMDLASTEPTDQAWLQAMKLAMQLSGTGVATYADARRHRARWLAFDGAQKATTLRSVLLAGDVGEGAWLVDLWRSEARVAPYRRELLAPDAAPQGLAVREAQICNCFEVTEPTICGALTKLQGSAGSRLTQLQAQLRCGTQCGSCLPALRRLVARTPATQADAAEVAA